MVERVPAATNHATRKLIRVSRDRAAMKVSICRNVGYLVLWGVGLCWVQSDEGSSGVAFFFFFFIFFYFSNAGEGGGECGCCFFFFFFFFLLFLSFWGQGLVMWLMGETGGFFGVRVLLDG